MIKRKTTENFTITTFYKDGHRLDKDFTRYTDAFETYMKIVNSDDYNLVKVEFKRFTTDEFEDTSFKYKELSDEASNKFYNYCQLFENCDNCKYRGTNCKISFAIDYLKDAEREG